MAWHGCGVPLHGTRTCLRSDASSNDVGSTLRATLFLIERAREA